VPHDDGRAPSRPGRGTRGALKEIIEAPSLEVVRGLDARADIGYAVEAGAAIRRVAVD
jgi:hypothetical protein